MERIEPTESNLAGGLDLIMSSFHIFRINPPNPVSNGCPALRDCFP